MIGTFRRWSIASDDKDLTNGPVVVGIGDRVCDHDRSLHAAAEWAARRRLDVKLVTGIDPVDPFDDEGESADQRRRRAMASVNTAAERYAVYVDLTRRVHTHVSSKPAIDALLEESETAGLVVLQRREVRPISRLRENSVTALVAARAHCPVLVVHGSDLIHPSGDRRGVLVGVDGRGHAGRAIAEAFEEASWRNVSLTAVLVWTPPVYAYVPPDAVEIDYFHTTAAAALAEQLAGHRELYPDVQVDQVLRCGDPVPFLVDLARRHELLVVARHAEGRGGKHNLGSVTARVIEEANCPVLVTPTDRPHVPGHRH